MIASAHPAANRLAYRIRTAITGQSNGLENAKLAWQQAVAVVRANTDLKRASKALDDGTLIECLLIVNNHPHLLETTRSLDHSLVETWKRRCETYGWRVADELDTETLAKVQAAIDEQGDLKDTLFKQYRSAVRSKNEKLRAYQIIELIADTYPTDTSAQQEFASQQSLLLEQAAKDIKDVHEQLIPAEPAHDVARRYLALGLPLASLKNASVDEALATLATSHRQEISDRIHALSQEAWKITEDSNWRDAEVAYLELDYAIIINESRGQFNGVLRAELENIDTRLAHIRTKYESNIAIRQAISELRDGKTNNGKQLPFAHRLDKLRSLETQAQTTGTQISDELQDEIKAAYTFARRRHIPLYAALAATLVIIVTGIIFFVQRGQELDAKATLQSEALAALQATEQSGQTEQVRQALAEWNDTIASAEPGSSLANQATLLEDWLALQTSLESNYESAVTDFAKLATSSDSLENEAAIQVLAADIRKTSEELAPDLGEEADAQFAAVLSDFEKRKATELEQDQREITRIENELRIAANNAAQAKSRAEFERLQTAATTRAQTLESLLGSDAGTEKRSQIEPLLQSVTQQLSDTETKWAALDNAWARLSETKELGPYLAQLERIHSFDILPAEQKAAISQTLRLKPAFINLRKSQSLFSNPEADNTFVKGQSYLESSPELSPDEEAYIKRLQNMANVGNVYQSTVQYFEGAADPQSEYRIFLVEPISKSDSQAGEPHLTFTFKVRGFDELGNPEPEASNNHFISRDDGSFWGFFYKPSTLSPESQYYKLSISNALHLLLAESDRLTLLKLFAELETQDQLSPAFRIYWQQQIIGFMQLQPWKRGLALTPALQRHAAKLASLPSGEVSETLWLSSIEQTVPSSEYTALVEEELGELPQKEAAALANLYQDAADGDFHLAGYVLADGKPDLLASVDPQAPLWTVNALTGSVDRLKPGQPLTPFAPILRFALASGEKPSALLRNATLSSGFKLSEPPYYPLLPSLYK